MYIYIFECDNFYVYGRKGGKRRSLDPRLALGVPLSAVALDPFGITENKSKTSNKMILSEMFNRCKLKSIKKKLFPLFPYKTKQKKTKNAPRKVNSNWMLTQTPSLEILRNQSVFLSVFLLANQGAEFFLMSN